MSPATAFDENGSRHHRRRSDENPLTWLLEAAFGSKGRKIASMVALLSLGALGAKTAASVAALPSQTQAHDSAMTEFRNYAVPKLSQMDSLLSMRQDIREMKMVHEEQLCIQVATLRHSDWTRCLVRDAVSVIQ